MPTRKKGAKPGKPGSSRSVKKPRKVRTVTIDGQQYTIAQAAKVIGISREALYQRLGSPGWSEADAVKKEPKRRASLYLTVKTPDGPVIKPAKQWAEEMDGDTDINLARICMRKTRNWTDAQALGIDPPPSKTPKPAPAKSRTTRTKPAKGTPDE